MKLLLKKKNIVDILDEVREKCRVLEEYPDYLIVEVSDESVAKFREVFNGLIDISE